MMLTVTSLCWASVNNHACCGNTTRFSQQSPASSEHKACCITPAGMETKLAPQPFSGRDFTPAAPAAFIGFDFYQALLQATRQSLLHKAYVADQSGRHLELSVLLN